MLTSSQPTNRVTKLNKIAICFVCMGNICRSPTAEGVFRYKARLAGVEEKLHITSAGTHGYHIGSSPDKRSASVALTRGYDLSTIKSRRVEQKDFTIFDYILPMDKENFAYLKALKPVEAKATLKLFMDFSKNYDERNVPDPYFGGNKGFELVLDMIEDAADGFIEYLIKSHTF